MFGTKLTCKCRGAGRMAGIRISYYEPGYDPATTYHCPACNRVLTPSNVEEDYFGIHAVDPDETAGQLDPDCRSTLACQ